MFGGLLLGLFGKDPKFPLKGGKTAFFPRLMNPYFSLKIVSHDDVFKSPKECRALCIEEGFVAFLISGSFNQVSLL